MQTGFSKKKRIGSAKKKPKQIRIYPRGETMIQILIVDDQALVRTGLKHILDQGNEIIKVTEASSGEAVLSRRRKFSPDVILLSINSPGLTGFEMTRKLKRFYPGAGIIILAKHAKPP